MRVPIYRVTNDDDPSDYAYPLAIAHDDLPDDGFVPTVRTLARGLDVGQNVTIGGGAAPQFTLTRIR